MKLMCDKRTHPSALMTVVASEDDLDAAMEMIVRG
jgi:hypothetical protein